MEQIKDIDLQDVEFDDQFSADGYIFPTKVDFTGAVFRDRTSFNNAVFLDVVHFNSIFTRWTYFEHATFVKEAYFADAKFTYSEEYKFTGAVFKKRADFSRVIFEGHVDFSDTKFNGETLFNNAKFGVYPLNFIRTEFNGNLSFQNASFGFPPTFFEATIFEGTIWDGVEWPLPSSESFDILKYRIAYERLKAEMDRLKKHEAELEFFSLELRCKRVMLGRFRGAPIALYGCLCDYGRDYWRPLIGLVITVLVGMVFIWSQRGSISEAAALSLANTFAVLGFRREFFGSEVLNIPYLRAVGATQMAFGMIFLFLFGLAIRNQFRMK